MKDIYKSLQLLQHNTKHHSLNNSLDHKSLNPIISITESNNFYNIYISLRGLNQKEILLNYINNFLIIIFSIQSKYNNSIEYKRSFYLKNVDINKTKNIACANLIHLKAPKIITQN